MRVQRTTRKYRRSRTLVLYWVGNQLAYFDCRTGERRTLSIDVVPLLGQLDQWATARMLAKQSPDLGDVASVEALLRDLVSMGLAESDAQPSTEWPWLQWMPEAAFFHFGTRDGRYPEDFLAREAQLRDKAKVHPPPPATKSVPGPRLPLPSPLTAGDLGQALQARRTWRNFATEPVALSAVATILGLTWGVRARGYVEGQGEVIFKTSPSGGSRHPIEVYLIANRIAELPSGVYHYQCQTHELVTVGGAIPEDHVIELLAHQYYFGPAAALFVMTARFERTMWRYPITRAYRAVLAEAGHLGQTFCLLATHFGLGPFTTMAFHDSRLEQAIGIRDAGESSLYVVGLGTRATALTSHPGTIPPRR